MDLRTTNVQNFSAEKFIPLSDRSNFTIMLGYAFVRQIIRLPTDEGTEIYNRLRTISKAMASNYQFQDLLNQLNFAYCIIKNVMDSETPCTQRINWLDVYLQKQNLLEAFELLFECIMTFLVKSPAIQQRRITLGDLSEAQIISILQLFAAEFKIHIFLYNKEGRQVNILSSDKRQKRMAIFLKQLDDNQFCELLHERMCQFENLNPNLQQKCEYPFYFAEIEQNIPQTTPAASIASTSLVDPTSSLHNSFYESLTCPICYELCDNAVETKCCGIVGCEACFKRLNRCPSCRNFNFRFVQSLPIRRIIGGFPYECPDCQYSTTYDGKSSHQLKCPERVYQCKLCTFSGKQQAFLTHLQMEHPIDIVQAFAKGQEEQKVNQGSQSDRNIFRSYTSGINWNQFDPLNDPGNQFMSNLTGSIPTSLLNPNNR